MRIVISQDNNKLYKSALLAFDPSMEIIALNPLDCTNPDWETIPESDALFMCYQFLFAARDNPDIHDALLSLAKRMKMLQIKYLITCIHWLSLDICILMLTGK